MECNYIGTDPTGTASINHNARAGINFTNNATNLNVTNNLISGNGESAIFGNNSNVTGVKVQNNLMGTDITGKVLLANVSADGNFGDIFWLVGNPGMEITHNVITGGKNYGIGDNGANAGLKITGNYIGTDITGTVALPNGAGVQLQSDAVIVGGTTAAERNVISGNTSNGIMIYASTGDVIKGNYIGVTADAQQKLGNGPSGISTTYGGVQSLTIGGSLPSEANIIGGNGDKGIFLIGVAVSADVKGNYVGTNTTGANLGNTNQGILIVASAGIVTIGGSGASDGNVVAYNGYAGIGVGDNSNQTTLLGNYVGVLKDGTSAGNNGHGIHITNGASAVIGGSQAGEGNVVAGNTGIGINVEGKGAIIKGNIIGLAPDGTTIRANGGSGIRVNGGSDPVIIGGSATGEGNIIAGNTEDGINTYFSVSPFTIYGNKIGVAKDGSFKPNRNGILIDNDQATAGNIVIGGLAAGQSNTIAGNTQSGVFIGVDGGGAYDTQIPIRKNSIYANGYRGIALSSNGTTPLANDLKDPDVGPNMLQNAPVVQFSMKACDGTTQTAPGKLNSTPNTTFIVDYYANPSYTTGTIQGEQWLSSQTVTTDANGDAVLNPPSGVANLSATATDPNGNTSEFGSISAMEFNDCQDMIQRVVAQTTNDFNLGATWSGVNIPDTYYRNMQIWNGTDWVYNLEKVGLTVQVKVGGQDYTWQDPPAEGNAAYALGNYNWYTTGHLATNLPKVNTT